LSQPIVTGWSIQFAGDGRHRVVPFGNARHGVEGVNAGWREPHVVWQVNEEDGLLYVEAELPGVKKEDVHVEMEGDVLRIRAHGSARRYEAELAPGVVLGKRPRARYENGLLRVYVDLPKRARAKPREVKVKG
jgi:HSP20 family molecular chaperone IbpA